MGFEEYEPKSTLVVPQHSITHAKYPFFDVHNHQWDVPSQDLKELFAQMDKLNMAVMNNLSGKSYKESPGEMVNSMCRGTIIWSKVSNISPP